MYKVAVTVLVLVDVLNLGLFLLLQYAYKKAHRNGTILALYDYLRFDSIFEFGWKYQFNHVFQYYFVPTIKDFLLGLKYHLLQFPEIDKNSYTLFSSFKGTCHRVGNEGAVSLLYLYPLSLITLLTPILFYIKRSCKISRVSPLPI